MPTNRWSLRWATPAFGPGSLHLGNIHVEEADRVTFEALALGLDALDVRQAGEAVLLQAAMQRRPGQMRDRWLQSVEAVIQRQQGNVAGTPQPLPPRPRTAWLNEGP